MHPIGLVFSISISILFPKPKPAASFFRMLDDKLPGVLVKEVARPDQTKRWDDKWPQPIWPSFANLHSALGILYISKETESNLSIQIGNRRFFTYNYQYGLIIYSKLQIVPSILACISFFNFKRILMDKILHRTAWKPISHNPGCVCLCMWFLSFLFFYQ